MLDVTLFRHPVFTVGVAASAISFMSISSVRFLMPFYLQTVLRATHPAPWAWSWCPPPSP